MDGLDAIRMIRRLRSRVNCCVHYRAARWNPNFDGMPAGTEVKSLKENTPHTPRGFGRGRLDCYRIMVNSIPN